MRGLGSPGSVVSRVCSCEGLEARRLLSAQLADDVGLPRYLTDAEREYLKLNPQEDASLLAPTAPPTGPVDPVAEYDPMEGLVVSWVAQQTILAQIGRRVTVEGNGRLYVGVRNSTDQNNAVTSLTSAGANLSNVTFFTLPLNSVWARDYGPRYVYEGDVRVITDHKYNRPTRTSDDVQPLAFANLRKHQYYEIGANGTTLVHGGGNYHLNTHGDAYATELVTDTRENPVLTESQILQTWSQYQNNSTTITDRFWGAFTSTSNPPVDPTPWIDATAHIDMWMQIFGDNEVFISDWPNAQGSHQDQVCEATASLMQSRGYNVTRIPAYSQNGGIHYTYTNMVIFNDIVLLPLYDNAGSPGAAISNQVLAQVQAAMPGKTVYQIDGDAIVNLAGVFHCIVQHIPVHKGLAGANGGLAPTAYLRGPNNGESYIAGDQVELKWITDDDAPVASTGGVQAVDIQLSTDGGATFPITIASNQPALGSYLWTVPSGINTSQARVRVVARDAVSNTGSDQSDLNFTITDPVPAVVDSDFLFETAPHQLTFAFSQNVSASLTLDDIVLENLTTAQTIASTDLSLSYNAGNNTATLTYVVGNGALPDGQFRATLLASGITNPGGTPMTSNHVMNFHVLGGDADRDADVDLDDFNILANNFGTAGRNFSQANFSYDAAGVVDLDDFNILASKFGTALVGEPASAGGRLLDSHDHDDDTDELLA